MKRQGNKLTAAAVRAASKPGLYGDGHGLYLQVSAFDTKSWVFRFMIDGRARKKGLGPIHTVSLAEARKRAADARLKALDGIDPIDEHKAQRAARKVEAAKALTFGQAAESYIKANRSGWRSDKHANQWRATFRGDTAWQARLSSGDCHHKHPARIGDRYGAGRQGLGAALVSDA